MRSNFFKEKGQSTVEFVLIAPLLFFIFFGIIQIAYLGYASLAVQRATLSIAKSAARSQLPELYDPHFQLFYSLIPLETLNKSILATVLSTECSIQSNGTKVHVEVRYPMPIWVPLVGRFIGEPLSTSSFTNTTGLDLVQKIFQIIGKSPPDLSLLRFKPPYVRWITFSADTFDENGIF